MGFAYLNSFQKAFDTIDHAILLKNMKEWGSEAK